MTATFAEVSRYSPVAAGFAERPMNTPTSESMTR
jgi:hypothetical protein